MPSDLGGLHWIRTFFDSKTFSIRFEVTASWSYQLKCMWQLNTFGHRRYTAAQLKRGIFLSVRDQFIISSIEQLTFCLPSKLFIWTMQTHVKYPCAANSSAHVFNCWLCQRCCRRRRHLRYHCHSIKYHFQSLHWKQIRAVSFWPFFRQHEAYIHIVLWWFFPVATAAAAAAAVASTVVAVFTIIHNSVAGYCAIWMEPKQKIETCTPPKTSHCLLK